MFDSQEPGFWICIASLGVMEISDPGRVSGKEIAIALVATATLSSGLLIARYEVRIFSCLGLSGMRQIT